MEENEAGESELRILYRIRGNARRRVEEGDEQAQSILMAVEELIDERERAPLSDSRQRSRMLDP